MIIGQSKTAATEIYATGCGAGKADGSVRLISLTLYTEVNNLEAYFALWVHLNGSILNINKK